MLGSRVISKVSDAISEMLLHHIETNIIIVLIALHVYLYIILYLLYMCINDLCQQYLNEDSKF